MLSHNIMYLICTHMKPDRPVLIAHASNDSANTCLWPIILSGDFCFTPHCLTVEFIILPDFRFAVLLLQREASFMQL